jgi:hypothetical protein
MRLNTWITHLEFSGTGEEAATCCFRICYQLEIGHRKISNDYTYTSGGFKELSKKELFKSKA